MTIRMLFSTLACAGLVLSAGSASAQSKKAAPKPEAAPAAQPAADGQASPQAAAAEAWAKMNRPGEPHKLLAAMEGNWDLEVKAWMPGDTAASVSKATCASRMILGGRFLQEDVTGLMMNEPFVGMSLSGYDNIKQKYVSTWIDNMTTGIFKSEGAYDSTGKALTMVGAQYDVMADKDVSVRTITRMVDGDKHVFEWYAPGPDGKEMKVMEITYTRKP